MSIYGPSYSDAEDRMCLEAQRRRAEDRMLPTRDVRARIDHHWVRDALHANGWVNDPSRACFVGAFGSFISWDTLAGQPANYVIEWIHRATRNAESLRRGAATSENFA